MRNWAVAVLVIAAVSLVIAADSKPVPGAGWQAGAARVDITPTRPTIMYGYANRVKPHEGVSAPLLAKALALVDEAGRKSVIITMDLGGIHGDTSARIVQRLHREAGVDESRVILNASHTHSGPWSWVAREEAAGSPYPEEALKNTREYVAELEKKLGDVAIEAIGKVRPVSLSRGLGVATFVMNRREFTPTKGVILGVNPRGYVDRGVPVLRVDGADGKPFVILYGTACHNTSTGSNNYMIDPDFAGHSQAEVERRMPGVTAMYINGCAGSANPWPRGTVEIGKGHGLTLGTEVVRVAGEKLQPVRGELRTVYRRVDLPLAPLPAADELERMAKSTSWQRYMGTHARLMIEQGRKPATTYAAPLTVWQFGDGLTLVGMSGEVVGDYVPLIERELGPLNLWIAAYCYDVFGYVPTARILEEGGYETRGIDRGDAVGQFAPAVQDVLVNAVRDAAKEAGRK